MSTVTINEMREKLMETLSALRDRENPMEVDRARAVAQVASVLVDSAKVEVEYIRAIGGKAESEFITPARLTQDGNGVVTPTPTGRTHRIRG